MAPLLNAAIATGGFKQRHRYVGKAIDENSRYTDTWVKMPGDVAARHFRHSDVLAESGECCLKHEIWTLVL